MNILKQIRNLVRDLSGLLNQLGELAEAVPDVVEGAWNTAYAALDHETWWLRKRILPIAGGVVGGILTVFTLLPLIPAFGWGWQPLPLWVVALVYGLAAGSILATGVTLYWSLGALAVTVKGILAVPLGAIPAGGLDAVVRKTAKEIVNLVTGLLDSLTKVSVYLAVLPSWGMVPLLLVSTNNDKVRSKEQGKFAKPLLGFGGVSMTALAVLCWLYLVWGPFVLTSEYGNARLAEVVTPTHLLVTAENGSLALREGKLPVGQKLCLPASFYHTGKPTASPQTTYAVWLPPEGTVDCVVIGEDSGDVQKRSVEVYWHRNPWTISGWYEIASGFWARTTAQPAQNTRPAGANQTPPAANPGEAQMVNGVEGWFDSTPNQLGKVVYLYTTDDHGLDRMKAVLNPEDRIRRQTTRGIRRWWIVDREGRVLWERVVSPLDPPFTVPLLDGTN